MSGASPWRRAGSDLLSGDSAYIGRRNRVELLNVFETDDTGTAPRADCRLRARARGRGVRGARRAGRRARRSSNGRGSGWLPRGPLRTAPETSSASATASFRMRSSSTTGLLGSVPPLWTSSSTWRRSSSHSRSRPRSESSRSRSRRHGQPSFGCARPGPWTAARSRTRAGRRVSSMRVGWSGSSCSRRTGEPTLRPALLSSLPISDGAVAELGVTASRAVVRCDHARATPICSRHSARPTS